MTGSYLKTYSSSFDNMKRKLNATLFKTWTLKITINLRNLLLKEFHVEVQNLAHSVYTILRSQYEWLKCKFLDQKVLLYLLLRTTFTLNFLSKNGNVLKVLFQISFWVLQIYFLNRMKIINRYKSIRLKIHLWL